MEKIILKRKEYNAIKFLLENNTKEDCVNLFVVKTQNGNYWEQEIFKPLNNMELDKFCKALYIGYELKENKKERLLSSFLEASSYDTEIIKSIYRQGIKDALKILEIKIKGISE